MNLQQLAKDRGYIVEERQVQVEGKTRACWQVFDLADHTFVHEGVGWTTAEDVEAYICEASD